MKELILNGKKVSLDYPFSKGLTPYEKKVLDFCHQWLKGRENFSIFTSGSTGKPKEVRVTRKQMEASALMTAEYFGLKKDDKILVCLSVEYIAGMMMIVRGFTSELEMEIIEPSSNPLKNIPSDKQIDFTSMVPMQLYEILTKTPEKISVLNRMKALLLGGAGVNQELEALIQQLKVPVFLSYGMTETVSHIALRKLNGPGRSEYFEVQKGIETGTDERGCLTIRGNVTDDKLITTNDLVNFVSEHKFELLGRIDNVINSGGHKVSLEKVEKVLEKVLSELNIRKKILVSSLPDMRLGRKLIVVFENYQLSEPEKLKITERISNILHKYEIPKIYYSVDAFCLTATGKIDRIKTAQYLSESEWPE